MSSDPCGCDLTNEVNGVLKPHLCERHAAERAQMSQRTFHRTTFIVEVLSEEPVPDGMDLGAVVEEAKDGEYSMRYTQTAKKIDAIECVRRLGIHGSEPGFFQLTDEGRDENTYGD